MDYGPTMERLNHICEGLKDQKSKSWSRINTGNVEESDPLRVLITGAAGQIGYSLIFMIARGQMFGLKQKVILHLFDLPESQKTLEGVEMEIIDSGYPLVAGVVRTCEMSVGFKNVNVACMVGAFPRKQGMTRADLLEKNAQIFAKHAKGLEEYAEKDVKILVVGNPANTNAFILSLCCNIPKENISCMSRLDHNRAKAQIADKIGCTADEIKNVIIWGNHSNTQYPDLRYAYWKNQNQIIPIEGIISNKEWKENTFVLVVQNRGTKVIEARKASSAASAAKAICDHIRDWVLGTKEGEFVSMGIPSDGSYGISKGIIYSFPVKCEYGKYKVIDNLSLDELTLQKMKESEKELLQEKELAIKIINKN